MELKIDFSGIWLTPNKITSNMFTKIELCCVIRYRKAYGYRRSESNYNTLSALEEVIEELFSGQNIYLSMAASICHVMPCKAMSNIGALLITNDID
uniref:Uncharacterized protein n=1 Tax=Glossina palpalis gambiensis TaxID=67801 RepID=A0A1B0BH38_9MUSC